MRLKNILRLINNFRKVRHRAIQFLRTALSKGRYVRDVKEKLPANLVEVALFSYTPLFTNQDRIVVEKVEAIREAVSTGYREDTVETFGSPHSGTSLFDDRGQVVPGAAVKSTNAGFARTGTGAFGGIQLRKVAEALRSNRILELGTNTGLSGCYFLSARQRPFLYSIEGSQKLSEIARKNLGSFSSAYHVENSLFDDALSELDESRERFDLAFIDGQHEEKATLYYANRIKGLLSEGGAILFDDIFWSEGMHSAWSVARKDPDAALTLELGGRGLCVFRHVNKDSPVINFDQSSYSGRPLLTREGW
ncbi:MAG: hypothetical protein CMD99_07170 [Gammaproteobacteria bacterium]|nr:hypothetical protein [Gammaproteobacteria bacterium]